MPHTLSERLRARCKQLGLNAGQVAELAGLNRSFVYDIMRGRSENPNLERLDKVAEVLRVQRHWLLFGYGDVHGEPPILDNPDEVFVPIPSVAVTASMGGGNVVEDEPEGRPYHFQRSWIRHKLRAEPKNLRVMHVEGDSMMPTLQGGDIVLVDLARRSPTPPGIFVVHDGLGLVAKRLEHIPNTEPARVRIISDNTLYAPYDCTADEVNIIGRIRWYAREI
jgi:phage repressor protein C with HTH and peptisase S24 domain